MNKVILMGRLTRDPEVRYTADGLAIARYSLAVDRGRSKDAGGQQADFFDCVGFGKTAEFTEKYLKKGIKMLVSGRLQNSNYEREDGTKVYRTEVVIETQEFAESKHTSDRELADNASVEAYRGSRPEKTDDMGFINVPDGIDEDELPFG